VRNKWHWFTANNPRVKYGSGAVHGTVEGVIFGKKSNLLIKIKKGLELIDMFNCIFHE